MPSRSDLSSEATVGIIPARLNSEEVHAKVLEDLGGRPVLQHVWERVSRSPALDAVLVVTDDRRIEETARSFGARTFRSLGQHNCGSDRCHEAVCAVFPQARLIVNVQADEPFLHPDMIGQVLQPLQAENGWDISTLCYSSDDASAGASPFSVKIAQAGATGRAIYFSRALIPFPRYPERSRLLQHIGIYAYTRQALEQFAQLGPSSLEQAEGLEQLRAIEAGMRIKVAETRLPYPGIAIDTPDDIEQARRLVAAESADPHRGGTV